MTLCRSALTVLPGHLSGEQSAGNCSVKESKIARVVACGVLSLRLIRAGARGGWYRKADRGPEVRPPGSPAERCEHGGFCEQYRGTSCGTSVVLRYSFHEDNIQIGTM